MLKAHHLSIGYEDRTLATDVDFSVGIGEIVCVLGPNGRGKTTLIRTLLGLLPAQGGTIARQGSYAYVPQNQPIPFAYDVLGMVTMGRARHLKWYRSSSRLPGRSSTEPPSRAQLHDTQRWPATAGSTSSRTSQRMSVDRAR